MDFDDWNNQPALKTHVGYLKELGYYKLAADLEEAIGRLVVFERNVFEDRPDLQVAIYDRQTGKLIQENNAAGLGLLAKLGVTSTHQYLGTPFRYLGPENTKNSIEKFPENLKDMRALIELKG